MSSYQQALDRYGSYRAAAAAVGLPKTTFRDRLSREREGKAVAPLEVTSDRSAPLRRRAKGPPARRPRVSSLSEQELLSAHDPYEKARTNMAAIPSLIEEGRFTKDYEMRKAVGLQGDSTLFREIAEDPEMELLRFQFVMGKGNKEAIYWTDPESKRRILTERPLIARDIVQSVEEA